MRIIAGRYGGQHLSAPKGQRTRPTADRVREALFSILGDLSETEVLDLFAGSGALGIEALSRGAKHAVFVERTPAALATLNRNIERLGVEDATVAAQDARSYLRAAKSKEAAFDVVFLDPPYQQAKCLSTELPPLLLPLLNQGARVIAESSTHMPLDLQPHFKQTHKRRYGDTLIQIYEH